MLRLAGREANIVGLLPQTLPNGGHDWLSSTAESLAERIGWVREGAGDRFGDIELSLIAFRAIATDRPADAAAEVAAEVGLTPDQVLASPDFVIGTVDDLVERLEERRERLGISHMELPDGDAVGFAPVVARLSGR
jgi:hypothetical protein